jgi:B12-binding domain/radical SAM domain protein
MVRDVVLVARHVRTGVHALNVLTASLRADPSTASVRIRFAKRASAFADEIRLAAESGAHVLALWSFYSPEADAVRAELADVRGLTQGVGVVTHVAGGVHATAEPLRTLLEGFDLVAIGEGERTIRDLVRCASAGGDLGQVGGVARLEGGLVRSTGPGEKIELDDYPAFNLPDRAFNPIEITRGCVYACRFCQTPFMFKARFRHRSVDNVREHVRIQRRENLRFVRFVTPTSLSYGADGEEPNLDAVEALLAAVREEIGPEGKVFFGTFPSEVRPEHVTPRALRILKRYVDNDNLVLGGQSGSQRVLDDSLRGHSVEDVVRAVRVAGEHGFRANVDFLFGLPGETGEDAEKTARLMRELVELGARVHTHTFMPLPGTPLKDAPAGEVDPAIVREIGKLEAAGRSYGKWREQIVSASSLARRRRERRHGAT